MTLNEISKSDTVIATVIHRTAKGVFLHIDNQIKAFAYASLPKGATVLATVKKIDYQNPFVLLAIDSCVEH